MSVTHVQAPVIEQPFDVPVIRITARRGWLALDLPELWAYRELLYFFVFNLFFGRHVCTEFVQYLPRYEVKETVQNRKFQLRYS